jgi:hypothetical protein
MKKYLTYAVAGIFLLCLQPAWAQREVEPPAIPPMLEGKRPLVKPQMPASAKKPTPTRAKAKSKSKKKRAKATTRVKTHKKTTKRAAVKRKSHKKAPKQVRKKGRKNHKKKGPEARARHHGRHVSG